MDVLLFQVHENIYGADLATVMEIIDPVTVTPLPFVSPAVEGLIHVAGKVIPQICANRRLHPKEMANTEDGEVIIFSTGLEMIACRVTRVIAMITIDAGSVLCAPMPECNGKKLLINGGFHWKDAAVQLLNPHSLMHDQMLTSGSEDGIATLADTICNFVEPYEAIHVDDFPCIVFACNNEYFALRLADVEEIVECGTLQQLLNAPPELAGMGMVRGVPLLLLSTSSILFEVAGGPTPVTVVVRINGFRIGLQAERIVGKVRFACSSLRQFSRSHTLLEGFTTTPDGTLVALLRLSALATPERLGAWRSWLTADNEESISGMELRRMSEAKKRMLLFRLGKELMALPMECVKRIEEYVEPTGTPGSESSNISGVIQVQGDIIPVRSVEKLAGLATDSCSGAYLIVENAGSRCAVPVDKVESMIDINLSDIRPVTSGEAALFDGISSYNGMIVRLIDVERAAV